MRGCTEDSELMVWATGSAMLLDMAALVGWLPGGLRSETASATLSPCEEPKAGREWLAADLESFLIPAVASLTEMSMAAVGAELGSAKD